MISRLPTGIAGKVLALGLLAIAMLILWIGVASPLFAWYEDRDATLAQRRLLVARMEAVARTLPALKAASEAGADAPPPIQLLAGTSDALAAAQLQETLGKISTASNAALLSTDGVPAQEVGAMRRIGLRIALSGRYADLIAYLSQIETASPALLINDLQIQDAQTGDPNESNLLANLTVYGFRAGDQSP